jgi:hypothetical protein
MEAIIIGILISRTFLPKSPKGMLEIITNELPELLPQKDRLSRLAVPQDEGKESPELLPSLHGTGILETENPFIIILQESSGQTGSLEGWMDSPIIGAEVLK